MVSKKPDLSPEEFQRLDEALESALNTYDHPDRLIKLKELA